MSDDSDILRPFPHAVGPEKSILSTMMQDPAEFIGLAIEEGVTSSYFYQPSNQTIFEVLIEQFDQGLPVDLVSLVQCMLDTGRLERAGGPAGIYDVYGYATTAGQFRYHLGIVKDKFIARSLLNACAETSAAVWDSPDEIEATLDQAEASIMAIREGKDTLKIESIKEAVQWVVEDFEERVSGKKDIQGISTGFEELDRMTGGLMPGEMYVIAARPSMGKTSFMMNIVEHITVGEGIPSMVFSCEMGQRALVKRLVHSRARFNAAQLNRGCHPAKGDLQRIQRAALDVARAPLTIDDTEAITLSALRAKARRRKRERGIKLIAIDYLQLVRSYTKQATNSREREISEISAGIKGLAKELDLPVIILAQLNRGPETRNGKKAGAPRMSDLRESGSIEQDADFVGMLYRSAYYADTDEAKAESAGRAELIVAKNRNGDTGTVPLTFIKELVRFESGQPHPEEPEPAPVRAGWGR